METLQPPTGEPTRSEKWDPNQRILSVETFETLKPGLKEVDISMTSGRIVIKGTDEKAPKLVTRLFVSAGSETEAKKYLGDREDKALNVERGDDLLKIDARGQEGIELSGGSVIVSGRGSVVIGGNIIGGTVIGGGKVWINGQRVDVSREGAVVAPGIQREVVLNVPKDQERRYTLETQAGSVEVRSVKGECGIGTSAADVEIAGYEGRLSLNNKSGDVEIERFNGDLNLNATSGDVKVAKFAGNAQLVATSGDIKLRRVEFKGRNNNIQATSGDISIGVTNDSLGVRAETSSGKIRTPKGEGFVITREDRPTKQRGQYGRSIIVVARGASVVSIGGAGGRSFVEGRFGDNPNPENQLNVNATSGDVTIAKH